MARATYTQEQAAIELGINRWKLMRWHRDGKISVGVRNKITRRYTYTDRDLAVIRKWLEGANERPGEGKE